MPAAPSVELMWRSETDRKLGEHGAKIEAHEEKFKKTVTLDAFTPVQKIVYGAVSVILLGTMAAVGQVIRLGYFPW